MKYLKLVIVMAIVGIFLIPTAAFASTPYDSYEQWGPRAQNFLMKFHTSDALEFADLEAGAIDIVEWPLTKYYYDRWQDPSYGITIVGAGPEWGMYAMDLNNNETLPDGTHNPGSDPNFRLAIWHLIDRNYIATTIFQGMAAPLWAPIAGAAPDVWKNPACVNAYPYDLVAAAAILDAHGYTIDSGTGKRKDPATGLDMNLKVYYRSDHEYRRLTGIWFAQQLDAVNIAHTDYSLGSSGCSTAVMVNKDFFSYTAGWGLGTDVPDTLYGLYDSMFYWHPGRPPNYAHYSDPIADALIESAEYSPNLAAAIPYVQDWQERYIDPAWVPNPTLCSNLIYHAHRNVYGSWGGSETQYAGLTWKGMFNRPGVGIGAYNNFWTFMNMYPDDTAHHDMAPSGFTIRWGWKVAASDTLNPISGSWVWDWAIMNWIYDTLIGINPYITTEDKPWMAYQWNMGTWNRGGETCTFVTFKLRDDVYWSDGVKMTIEDLRWMIGTGPDDLYPLLKNPTLHPPAGSPDPWWYSSIADIDHYVVSDSQTISIYFDVQSYLALHWIGGLPLIPKHIWYDIVSAPGEDPEAHLADKYLIGNGPYTYVYPSYTPNVGVALTRNDLYFRNQPIDVRKTTWAYGGKNYARVTLYNYALEPIAVTVNGTVYNVPSAMTLGQYPGTVDFVLTVSALPTTLSVSYTYHGTVFNKVYDYQANTVREDTNLDGQVNYLDGIILGAAFNSAPGDLNWDSRADMLTDGHINYLDGIKLGAYFGWPNLF